MMNNTVYTIVNAKSGQITKSISNASRNVAEANLSNDELLISEQPAFMSDYWDGERFVSTLPPPSLNHVFDYATKQWIDPRSLDEIKAQKWAEIKKQRDHLEFGGFEFEGGIYDSDQVSQGRIMGAASAGIDRTWTLADNTAVELSASQLQQLYVTLQFHIASVHERGRKARLAIESAVTKEEVETIQL